MVTPAESGASGARDDGPSGRTTTLVLVLIAAFLFAVRLLGPSNLMDNDQERPASYVLDLLRNGHRFVQYDWTGDITSKPPLYTWLAAGTSLLAGRANLATLYLPCALAMLGASLAVSGVLRRVVGARAAFLGGLFLLANPLTAKLVALARTDAVFTGTVTATAVLAFRAWRGPRSSSLSWLAAWVAAALATLTKGPLGLLLGFAGLLAWFPERRNGGPHPGHRGHLIGLIAWIVLCGGWFLLAWLEAGDPLIRKMIHSELVGHALRREGPAPGVGLVIVPAYLLGRFAPWSLLGVWGVWCAFRKPSDDRETRALQRFAAAWLLAGLLTLGLASHHRGDLVAPLMPAAAILAAIPAARWIRRLPATRLVTVGTVLALAFGVGLEIQRTSRHREVFEQTRGMAVLAGQFRAQGGNPAMLGHLETPFALQWELGTMQRALGPTTAASHLLAASEASVSVTPESRASLAAALGAKARELRTLARWPASGVATVEILTLAPEPAR